MTVSIGLYFIGCFFLLADTFPRRWAIFWVAIHMLYSWIVVWLYAYLKVKSGMLGAIFLIPFLLTTSTWGIAIWLVFQPEVTIARLLAER